VIEEASLVVLAVCGRGRKKKKKVYRSEKGTDGGS
jgi:hypothetical protein